VEVSKLSEGFFSFDLAFFGGVFQGPKIMLSFFENVLDWFFLDFFHRVFDFLGKDLIVKDFGFGFSNLIFLVAKTA
jgi:hypothetical protein